MVMHNPITRLLALATLLAGMLAAAPASAALKAYVDRNPVGVDESFTLTLESSDDLSGSPDLSALQQDFEVLGQSRNTSFQIINGSASRKTQWQITLMARRSGQLSIPALSIDGEQSAPLTLTVSAAPAAQTGAAQGNLFLEVEAKPREAYVQQQIVYTVRLFHAVDFGNGATLTDPKLPHADAIVEKLGKDRSYQTVRNGMRYNVVERDYAIYPQKSGSFTIPPLDFEGDIVQNGGGVDLFNFDPFNTRTLHKRVRSAAISVNVKPQPAGFQGGQWLPARNVQLVEQWSQSPPHFTVGEPITRTVALMADGLTAAQLPALITGSVNGVKQYPDQPALKDTKDSSGVTAMRTEKIALIPSQAGSFTLPAIAVPWWNTTTNRMEVARLPAHTYTVAPAAGTAPAPIPQAKPVPQTTPAPQPGTAASAPPGTPLPLAAPPQTASSAGLWPWVALLLGLGWLATALAWWWRSRRSAPGVAADMGDSLRQLERQLKADCLANDPLRCKQQLLAWARRRWPEHPPLSLTALAQRCAPPLAAAVLALDRALYAPSEQPWQGQELWRQFNAQRPGQASEKTSAPQDLRPLYPA